MAYKIWTVNESDLQLLKREAENLKKALKGRGFTVTRNTDNILEAIGRVEIAANALKNGLSSSSDPNARGRCRVLLESMINRLPTLIRQAKARNDARLRSARTERYRLDVSIIVGDSVYQYVSLTLAEVGNPKYKLR